MTKLVQINTVCNGSTGNIMKSIQIKANENGFETVSLYGRRKCHFGLNTQKFGGFFSFWFHVGLTTLFDKHGYGSYLKTKKMVEYLKKENPDIIHLHNIHGYYINIKVLFDYLNNEFKGKIVWTFHDFWPITGHCPHFILANCYKWKTQCCSCPNKLLYPISILKDNSKNNYLLKKRLFTKRNDIIIICPSVWGKELVYQSYFNNNKVIVINNGIDLKNFHKVDTTRIDGLYNLKDKKVILGVANIWDERKGLKTFVDLSKKLSKEYEIILIGLNKKQIKNLSKYKNIIGLRRTDSQKELIEFYSRADVFINPSKEETFSLVTIEALACETPIIVSKNTPMEEFVNEKNGVLFNDFVTVQDIEKVLNIKKYDFSNVRKYDVNKMTDSICKLYKSILEGEV